MRKMMLLMLVLVSLALSQSELAVEYEQQIEELDDRIDELENARSSYSWLIPVILSIAGLLIVLVGLFGVINQRRFKNTLQEAKDTAAKADKARLALLDYVARLRDELLGELQDITVKELYTKDDFLVMNMSAVEMVYYLSKAHNMDIPDKIVYLLSYYYFINNKHDHSEKLIKSILGFSSHAYSLLYNIYCKKDDYETARSIINKTSFSKEKRLYSKNNTYIHESNANESIVTCKDLMNPSISIETQKKAIRNTLACVFRAYKPLRLRNAARNLDREARLEQSKYELFKEDVKWVLKKYHELMNEKYIYNEVDAGSYYVDFFRANEDLNEIIRVDYMR